MKKTFNAAPPNAFLKLEIPGEREDCLLSVSSIAIPQRYVTLLSAQQASFLGSNPPVLNIPPGRYIFIAGAIQNLATNTVSLDLGGENDNLVIADEASFILTKQSYAGPVAPGRSIALAQYVSVATLAAGGSFRLTSDIDTPTLLDGPIKVTLLVYPL
jgi:hypothetical protein